MIMSRSFLRRRSQRRKRERRERKLMTSRKSNKRSIPFLSASSRKSRLLWV
jgi:hypothetical protein